MFKWFLGCFYMTFRGGNAALSASRSDGKAANYADQTAQLAAEPGEVLSDPVRPTIVILVRAEVTAKRLTTLIEQRS